MPTLFDVLPEGCGRDDEWFASREGLAAVGRTVRDNGVVPAREIARDMAATMLVGMIFFMHERADRSSIVRPGRGDEISVGEMRGVRIVGRAERNVAVDLKVIDVGSGQWTIDVV